MNKYLVFIKKQKKKLFQARNWTSQTDIKTTDPLPGDERQLQLWTSKPSPWKERKINDNIVLTGGDQCEHMSGKEATDQLFWNKRSVWTGHPTPSYDFIRISVKEI